MFRFYKSILHLYVGRWSNIKKISEYFIHWSKFKRILLKLWDNFCQFNPMFPTTIQNNPQWLPSAEKTRATLNRARVRDCLFALLIFIVHTSRPNHTPSPTSSSTLADWIKLSLGLFACFVGAPWVDDRELNAAKKKEATERPSAVRVFRCTYSTHHHQFTRK